MKAGPAACAAGPFVYRSGNVRKLSAGLFAMTMGLGPAAAADQVLLHAAGSLRGAMTDIAAGFEKQYGVKVVLKFGASGLLRDAIAKGEKAEVFASANMDHPRSLSTSGRSGPVVLFARNELCAFVRPGLDVTAQNLLEKMLDPQVRLGTSTPRADPSGDYAFEVFAKAERLKSGARTTLEAKALQLTGGPTTPPPPPDVNYYGKLIAEGAADLFLAYCTNTGPIAREQPAIRMVRLPETLAVGADYGLTVMRDAPATAGLFATYILAEQGQAILDRHGFAAPALPRQALK